jgi:hypothetical protein
VDVAYFKVLLHNLLGGTEEHHKESPGRNSYLESGIK